MLLKSEKVRFAFRGWLMAKIFQTNIEKHLRQRHHSTTMTLSVTMRVDIQFASQAHS